MGKKREVSKFEQLVDAIASGDISYTQLQIAMRASIRQREDLPRGIRDLLAGQGEHYSGLIYSMFKPIKEAIGAMELAYRRGADGSDDSARCPCYRVQSGKGCPEYMKNGDCRLRCDQKGEENGT